VSTKPGAGHSNLNASVKILKELDREREAIDLINFFVANKNAGPSYWNASDPFQDGPFDEDVQGAIDIKRKQGALDFVPEIDLVRAAQNLDSEIIKKLSEVSVDEYYKIVKSKKGDEMRKIILSGLDYRKYGNASPEILRAPLAAACVLDGRFVIPTAAGRNLDAVR
jgi:hypothetical protein